MPIYRGEGGSGESSTNALVNEVAQDAAAAANSANEAAASATSAANSATAAANSATAAAASETAAETAETNAETAETNAVASAAAAVTSETNASTSETNAATSETNAATFASNASTSETNASASATAAATSAFNAATSETNAATFASNASTSETNAATSASQAATSATSAATSASDAATTYDNFDDRYLGEKTSDPSVDNDGDALITGALYFNSTAGQMRVWDGSAWEAAYLPGSSYLELAGGTMTGTLTLNANPSNSLEAATKQYVDDIAAEGIQYHTPVRVEVEGNLTITYNNGTAGVGATLTNAGTQAALVIDDITMVVNDRVLIYEQTDATQNGIYTVTDIGSASTNWVLTRATDADSYAPSDPNALAQGSGFFVQEGTLGAGEKYVCNTVGTITFGTTNISFVQVATAQIYTAGTGISLNGSVINNTGLLTTGSTATDLAITSADINGGNIDGTIIGATTPAAATFAAFTSNGIDDNATSNAVTIDSSQNVILSGSYLEISNGGRLQVSGAQPQNADLTGGSTNGTDSDGLFAFYGGRSYNTGAGIVLNGADHANLPNVTRFVNGAFTERMRIDSSGIVQVGGTGSGIVQLLGASSGLEGGQLDIECTAGTGTFSIDAYDDRMRFLNGVSTGSMQFYAASNAAIGMEMAADGELQCHKGITIDGTDSTTGVNLNITGANPEIKFEETDGDTWWIHVNGSVWYLLQDKNADGTWTSPHPLTINGTNETMSFYNVFLTNTSHDLHVDGNVVAYSTSVSDERLKDDIQPITGALDTVDALRGVTFTWNDGRREGTRDYGLIAQEVEKVIPEVVHDTDLPLMKGEDDKTLYKTIDYDKLVAVLIEAVSELRAEVEELRGATN